MVIIYRETRKSSKIRSAWFIAISRWIGLSRTNALRSLIIAQFVRQFLLDNLSEEEILVTAYPVSHVSQ